MWNVVTVWYLCVNNEYCFSKKLCRTGILRSFFTNLKMGLRRVSTPLMDKFVKFIIIYTLFIKYFYVNSFVLSMIYLEKYSEKRSYRLWLYKWNKLVHRLRKFACFKISKEVFHREIFCIHDANPLFFSQVFWKNIKVVFVHFNSNEKLFKTKEI